MTAAARRRIPGPAGAIQDVVHRLPSSTAEASSSLAVAEVFSPDKSDFLLKPWLRAMEMLGGHRAWEPGIAAIAASDTPEFGRAARVVGVVKSCKPNGLGDLFLTLKDPSGAIGASVHRKVALEEDIRNEISVGCVFLLKQVVFFCPARSARYLNITLDNVIQIINKDGKDLRLLAPTGNSNQLLESGTRVALKRSCFVEKYHEPGIAAARASPTKDIYIRDLVAAEVEAETSCIREIATENCSFPSRGRKRPETGIPGQADNCTARKLNQFSHEKQEANLYPTHIGSTRSGILQSQNNTKSAAAIVGALSKPNLVPAVVQQMESSITQNLVSAGNFTNTHVPGSLPCRLGLENTGCKAPPCDSIGFFGAATMGHLHSDTHTTSCSITSSSATVGFSTVNPDTERHETNVSYHQKMNISSTQNVPSQPASQSSTSSSISAANMPASMALHPSTEINETKHLGTRVSAAEWTDEQLSQLFADYD